MNKKYIKPVIEATEISAKFPTLFIASIQFGGVGGDDEEPQSKSDDVVDEDEEEEDLYPFGLTDYNIWKED